jgi:hypothetical protein
MVETETEERSRDDLGEWVFEGCVGTEGYTMGRS